MTADGPGTTVRAESIAAELRRRILRGKYEVGERLPSERDLAATLGVHRSSVREALKKIEQLGMIEIRRGGGARVLPLARAGLGVLQHLLAEETPARELVAQWLDVWELFVAGTARLAVERATDEEFAEADALLSRLRKKSVGAEELIETGDELTGLIARASRNVVLEMVRNGLTAQLRERQAVRLRVAPARKAFAPVVREIHQAVRDRDPAAVEEGVRRLIRQNRQLVLDVFAGDGVN